MLGRPLPDPFGRSAAWPVFPARTARAIARRNAPAMPMPDAPTVDRFAALLAPLARTDTLYLIALTAVLVVVLLRALPAPRRALRNALLLLAASICGQVVAAGLEALAHARLAVWVHEVFVLGAGFALLRLLGLAVFRAVLPWLGVRVVTIVEDIVIFIAYAVFLLARLHGLGLDPASLLTTSAVITAVLAFAMQDTLGNVLAGVALHLDESLQTGDWIRVDEISGRVLEIRWRHTSVWTRNGEVVVIPNSQLMKGRFSILGRQHRPEWMWRRWIWFNVTSSHPPTRVIEKVERALRMASIANVAPQPAPNCVLMDFGPGYARYALRYWMIDPQADDPTDSAVRVHLHSALQRAGIELALPEQAVHVVEEGQAQQESARRRQIERRVTDLRKVALFASFQDEELRTIAERMVWAAFPQGAVIFSQGKAARSLYLLVKGEAEVLIDVPGHERQTLRTITAGKVFGVRGVMTGEPRRDTVVAATDVVCYRLDQATFQNIVRSRPEIAEEIAEILATLESELDAFSQRFAEDDAATAAAPTAGMLDKIRRFLKL